MIQFLWKCKRRRFVDHSRSESKLRRCRVTYNA